MAVTKYRWILGEQVSIGVINLNMYLINDITYKSLTVHKLTHILFSPRLLIL